MERLHLKSIKIEEYGKNRSFTNFHLPKASINNFHLFIGDNAQGKSRFFRTLAFIKELFSNERRKILTEFIADFEFMSESEKGKGQLIEYQLQILPASEENYYSETIKRENKVFLSTKDKKLFNEKTGEHISNFFVPKNTPAVVAIDDTEFGTIQAIRGFFKRMLFIDATKMKSISMASTATAVSSDGQNLSNVLENWRDQYPKIYKEVVDDFKACFKMIKGVVLVNQTIQGNLKTIILAMSEKNVENQIMLNDWSDGMFRLLWLLCAPKTPFKFDDKVLPPSLICVDEIENGLDYKTLKFVTQYLQDYSDDMQLFMSSHSPVISDFIHPKYWKIVKRNGPKVNLMAPPEKEQKLDEQLELFKHRHWDFYAKHISNSKLYVVK